MMRLSRAVPYRVFLVCLVVVIVRGNPRAFADDVPGCGDGIVQSDTGEECDGGGVCIGGANAVYRCSGAFSSRSCRSGNV